MHQLASPGVHRAITALMLLAPGTPMLFQGQEFSASAPFLFFADHAGELGAAVRRGRAQFLSQFPNVALPEVQRSLPDPGDRATFERCKLDSREREQNRHAVRLHQDLLRLRREDPAFRAQRAGAVEGAVLAASAFVLRFRGESQDGRDDRLLLVNLGAGLSLRIAPEPLLAPPADTRWTTLWSSEGLAYGGSGSVEPETDSGWRLTGRSALVLAPRPEPGGAAVREKPS
jgi:maltooligosyltrehalose trehalohydrolase